MAAQETIQIFISSPGDVAQERVIAERVIERLQGEFAGRADLEPIRWERTPLRATEHFQEQITPPAETDIAVFILWSRLGTPLPEDKFQKESGEPYRSGTEWEFENAVEGYQESGTPDLLTYRKTKDPEATLSDEEEIQQRLEQKKALDAFIERWFKGEEGESFRAAFHTFETPGTFERQLEEHLRRLVEEHLPERYTEGGQIGPAVEARWHRGSPFRGLQAFEAEHAPIFFGRTEETSQIIEQLKQQSADGRPFILIHGPSGSGKSSVAKAGVEPTITRPGVIEGIGRWVRAHLRPSDARDNLVGGLAQVLFRCVPEIEKTGFTVEEVADLLHEAPNQAAKPLSAGLRRATEAVAADKGLPEPPDARVLLVIDQLEEIFTLRDVGEEEREVFMEAVRALVESDIVWVVATLRSDFFGRLSEIEALRELKQGAGQYDLDPPNFAALGYMIRGPVRAAGLEFERNPEREIGLDEVLHEAAAEAPEALPLLEFTLEELYQRRTEDGVLTFEAYEELGGLTGAIAERAESVFEEQKPAVQAAFSEVVQALVTIEPEGEGGATGRRAPKADLTDTPEKEILTEALIEARLLVTERTGAGETVVSVAHEALLREWPRLEEWIERNRAFLQSRTRIRKRASHWEEEGRPEDLLLPTGQPLAEAQGLREEREEALGKRLQTYIERSIERAERQRRRRRQIVGGALAAFFLVVAGFGLFSYQQWTEAAEQRDQVQISQSQTLADEAYQQVEENDAMTGMLLALEALPEEIDNPGRPYVPRAQSALYHALMHNREEAFFDAHSAPITDAALGPEGRYLVTGSEDSTARLYDLDRRAVTAVLRGHETPVASVDFDSSASRVVTAAGATARVWRVPGGKPMRTFDMEKKIETARLSPNGNEVLTVAIGKSKAESSFTKISLYSVGDEGHRSTRIPRQGGRREIGFSPSGRYVYSYEQGTAFGSNLTVHLWNRGLNDSSSISIDSASTTYLGNHVKFLEDRQQLVISGWKNIEFDTSGTTRFLRESRGFARRLQVPDLSTVSATRRDGVIPIEVSEKGSWVVGQEFKTDSLLFFDPTTGKERNQLKVPSRLFASSLGSQYWTTAHRDGTIQVWRVPEGRKLSSYVGHVGGIQLLRTQPAKGRVVAVGREGVQSWAISEPPVAPLLQDSLPSSFPRGHGRNFVLGPNGDYVALVNSQGHPLLLSLENNQDGQLLKGHNREVLDLSFGPTGQRLATAGRDGTVRLWRVKTGEQEGVLRHGAPVPWLAFALNGKRIITRIDSSFKAPRAQVTSNGAVLWNVETQRRIAAIDSVQAHGWGQFQHVPSLPQQAIHVTPDRSKFLVVRDPSLPDSKRQPDSVLVEVRSAKSGNLQAQFGGQRGLGRLLGGAGQMPASSEHDGGSIGPNGRYALALQDSVVVLDLRENTVAGKISFPASRPFDLTFSPDGGKVAISGEDYLRIYNLATQNRLYTIEYPSDLTDARLLGIKPVEFAPTDDRLATVARATNAKSFPAVWSGLEDSGSVETEANLAPVNSRFGSIQFSSDGRYVLTYGILKSEEVRIYGANDEMPESYMKKVFHLQQPSIVRWARFTPDSKRIIIRTEDGQLRAWPLFDSPQALIDSARSALTRRLTNAQREQFNLTP